MIPLDAMPVPLANDRGWAWVDAKDWPLVCGKRWFINKSRNRKTEYAATNMPRSGGPLRKLYLHRFVGSLMGLDRSGQLDHRDRMGLNCTRGNLRSATVSQQLANQGVRRDSKCGYRGVQYCASNRGWRARIKCSGKTRVVASCARSAESAARIYDAWAREIYGDFASLNFPEEQ